MTRAEAVRTAAATGRATRARDRAGRPGEGRTATRARPLPRGPALAPSARGRAFPLATEPATRATDDAAASRALV